MFQAEHFQLSDWSADQVGREEPSSYREVGIEERDDQMTFIMWFIIMIAMSKRIGYAKWQFSEECRDYLIGSFFADLSIFLYLLLVI